jgi:hypothetical protein
MLIASNNDGDAGFTLPGGASTFTFTLIAPTAANLEPEYDENNQIIPNKIVPANIEYGFSTDSEDPCIVEVVSKVYGDDQVPYNNLTHIITNRNVTVKKKK